jgi:myo-inositol 2-dehydrogenase/D-chiro-inositol 1-dehydrogenase
MAAAKNTALANIVTADAAGFHEPPLLDFFMTRYTAAYANEIAAFVAAIADGAPTPTTGQDGLMALVLAEAALLSVAEGRAVQVADVTD